MTDTSIIAFAPTLAHDLPDGWHRMSYGALYSAIMRRRHEDRVTISTFHAVR